MSNKFYHPLDPLTPTELKRAFHIVKTQARFLGNDIVINSIEVVEVPKKVLWAWEDGSGPRPERQALVIVQDKKTMGVCELTLSLVTNLIIGKEFVSGVQPSFVSGEATLVEEIVKSDKKCQEIFKRLNVDIDDVSVECWTAGWFSPEDNPTRRLVRPLLYVKSKPDGNAYARPMDMVDLLLDLYEKKVVAYGDNGKADLPLPPADDPCTEFIPEYVKGPMNESLKPLQIVQPDGPSFTLEGRVIKWSNLEAHIGFRTREGLVLSNIKVDNRPVVYRLCVSEMAVPYGDPTAPNYRKNAFDAGEDGLGVCTNSLSLGCDCVGDIHYLDAHVINLDEEVETINNAICIHEEDAGVLWKHTEWRTGRVDVRRSRRLVISFFCTVANYDYGFYIYFYLDGTIEVEVKATGILSTSALHPNNTNPRYGTIIAPQLLAPIHQHFFVLKLDMAVDGAENYVEEWQVRRESRGAHNPHRNAMYAEQTLISNESMGARKGGNFSKTHWVVRSSSRKNRHGSPTSYRLRPTVDIAPFAYPDAPIMQRASFLKNNLWVTKTHPKEKYASGAYPNQRAGTGGLDLWVQQNRNLVDEDVTLWYVLGLTHVVRPEDWPVMPVDRISCKIEPFGFFDCNPCLNLPPSCAKESGSVSNKTREQSVQSKL